MPTRWSPQLPLPRIRPHNYASPPTQPSHTASHTNELHGSPTLSCAARSCQGSRGAPTLSPNTAAACSEGIISEGSHAHE